MVFSLSHGLKQDASYRGESTAPWDEETDSDLDQSEADDVDILRLIA